MKRVRTGHRSHRQKQHAAAGYRVVWLVLMAIMIAVSAPQNARADYSSAGQWFNQLSENDRALLQFSLILTRHYDGLTDAKYGRNTYRSIVRFQSSLGQTANGILSQSQWRTLNDRAGRVFNENGFKLIDDPRAQVQVPIATALVGEPQPTGRGTQWSSPRNDIQIETIEIPSFDQSYREVYEGMMAPAFSRVVSYSTFNDAFFVVTGTAGGRDYYVKFENDGFHTRGFSLAWAQTRDDQGELMSLVMASLTSSTAPVVPYMSAAEPIVPIVPQSPARPAPAMERMPQPPPIVPEGPRTSPE